MKQKTLLAIFGLVLCSGKLSAQIPNPYFETWDARSSQFPANWKMSGGYSRIIGPSAPFAVRLSNKFLTGEISSAEQVDFDTSGTQVPAFGISGTPDTLTLTYRSNLGPDTAIMYVFFKKSGDSIPCVFQEVLVTGNTTGWETRKFGLEYVHPDAGVVADTGYMLIYSSDPVFGPYGSGYIDIGGIAFSSNASALSNMPNHQFSNWDQYTFDFPVGWTTNLAMGWEQGVAMNHSARSTDARTGASAVRLKAFVLGRDTIPGFASTVQSTDIDDLTNPDADYPAFGLGSINRPQSFHGYVKTDLYGNDKFFVFVNLFHADTIVGSAVVKVGSNSGSFVQFSEDISWTPGFSGNAEEACITMVVADSTIDFVNDLRSTAIVDDIWFENFNVGLKKPAAHILSVYPNPARDFVHINGRFSAGSRIRLLSADGREVKNLLTDGTEQRVTISTAGLPGGLYLIQTEGSQQTFKILLQP